jgi:Lon protease-like protein
MESRRVPLFPLNVVLFPGMPLPLHIFEPRYRKMVRDCLAADRTFGVCLIRSGPEVGGPADPYPVGTTCEILKVTHLDDGRMHLMTVGRRRFRVLRLFDEQPYLEGEIEIWPEEAPGDLGELPGKVRDATLRYVDTLLSMHGESLRNLALPEDPLQLSHLVGALLQGAPELRQALLEDRDTAHRLESELAMLERELEGLEALRTGPGGAARPVHVDGSRLPLN